VKLVSTPWLVGAVLVALLASPRMSSPASTFDRDYQAYAALLAVHVDDDRVDYRALQANRAALDAVVRSFAQVGEADLAGWPRADQMAFWINAYNALTLQVIVDHYPIRGRLFSLAPRNSIRQIDGVWTTITWPVAGRRVTLDDIEHAILRPVYGDARIHFAVNCASVSCPPLALEPYRGATLDTQLDAAARRYLSSPVGLVVDGTTLRVSSLFKWYGDDFVEGYASLGPARGSSTDRAILGVVGRYGPEAARQLAASGRARVRFLAYDWSLNDVNRGPVP
jgi:hypothetical protein